jgi:hypothetical protein
MHMMFAFQRGRSAGPMGRSGGESHASVVSEWHAAALAWAWAPRAPHAEICCDFFREPLDCKLGTGYLSWETSLEMSAFYQPQ